MSNFVGLLINEHTKLIRRISTWIMAFIMIGVIVLAGIIIKVNFTEPDENWKSNLIEQTEYLKEDIEMMKNVPGSGLFLEEMTREIKLNEYRIENDIPPVSFGSLWGFMDFSSYFVQLIVLFTIIIAAGSVASEFSWGTIKLLLIRPATRTKVLLSKYLTTFLFALYFLILLFIVSLILSMIMFGTGALSQPHLAFEDGNIVERSMVLQVFSSYGLNCIQLLMMVTLAFMISTVFRSSAMAIGIAIFLMFVGSNVTVLLSNFDWAKYILFAHIDLSQHLNGRPLFEGTTMMFSIVVLAVYFIIFNLLSWFVFTKRDVSA